MARVTGSVLGNLSGKLGNLSARTVNGRTILASRPGSFNVSQVPAVLSIRKRFAVTIAVIKAILSMAILKEAWTKVKQSGMTVYNTVFKYNFPFSEETRPSVDNILTPGGFSLPVTSPTVGANDITAEIGVIEDIAEITTADKDAEFSLLLVLHNPTDPEDDPYKIINLSKEVADFDFTSAYSLSVALNSYQSNLAARYQNNILYMAFSTKDTDSKLVQHSATFAVES